MSNKEKSALSYSLRPTGRAFKYQLSGEPVVIEKQLRPEAGAIHLEIVNHPEPHFLIDQVLNRFVS